jgi:predicted Ser/Thr protein kinase
MRHARYPQIILEAQVIKKLQKADGIPHVFNYGTEGDVNYMVIDILGPSLEDLFNFCGR